MILGKARESERVQGQCCSMAMLTYIWPTSLFHLIIMLLIGLALPVMAIVAFERLNYSERIALPVMGLVLLISVLGSIDTLTA